MKRFLLFLTLSVFLLTPALAQEAVEEPLTSAYLGQEKAWESPTLSYTMDLYEVRGERCHLLRIRLEDPARQIVKAQSEYHDALAESADLARALPEARIVINGSGYVSPVYPWIPDHYPGDSEDYHYTPLGSITVTDGQIYRFLEKVPYYGLTLESDGLHMYRGTPSAEVMLRQPIQTWSFYEGCPMVDDGRTVLDRTWSFAKARAKRTILARLKDGDILLFMVEGRLSLLDCCDFLVSSFAPELVYDLDGGPSTALFLRDEEGAEPELIFGAGQQVVDVMGFIP